MSTTIEPTEVARRLAPSESAQHNCNGDLRASAAASQSLFWRKGAPKRLQDADCDAVAAWELYWAETKLRPSVAQLCGASTTPLAWSLDIGSLPPPCRRIIELADELAGDANVKKFSKGKARKQLRSAIGEFVEFAQLAPADTSLAVASLAASHVLGAVGFAIHGKLGWAIIDCLHRLAAEALRVSTLPDLSPQTVFVSQMLGGELPLTLSYFFPEMAPLHRLRKDARRQLSESLGELLNGQGLPHGRYISVMRKLAACWTRCRSISAALRKGCWSKQAERQYQCLIRQSLRWTVSDGTQLLVPESNSPWSQDFLQQALRLTGCKQNAAAARTLLGEVAIEKPQSRGGKTPQPYDNCEWSGLAMMRSNWSPDAAVVAIDYSGAEVKLELWSGRRRLLAGAWTAEPKAGGKTLSPAGAWEELCWYADKDVNYLELCLDLAGGARLERQIVLARRDGFLLLVDHLKHPETTPLQHDWQIPMASNVDFRGEGETRDALLLDGQPVARTMPLALPEWRIDPRRGALTAEGDKLRLSQQAAGRSVACPLFIDLRHKRSVKPSTWRQLTVAENLALQPADVAVAYRIQCGRQQWVYYRSQGPVGNRTFLGQNTSSDCLLARFSPKTGEVETLVEIEG